MLASKLSESIDNSPKYWTSIYTAKSSTWRSQECKLEIRSLARSMFAVGLENLEVLFREPRTHLPGECDKEITQSTRVSLSRTIQKSYWRPVCTSGGHVLNECSV